MAVLDDVRGIEVTVQVAGKEAVEYDVGEEEKQSIATNACPTSTKFIESIDDAKFSIVLNARDDYAWGYMNHALRFKVTVDTQSIMTRIFSSSIKFIIEGKDAYCHKTRQWQRHQLKFSAIHIVDGSRKERLEKDIQVVNKIGLITVIVERCTMGPQYAPPKKSFAGDKKFELSEKSMKGKAISHGTTFEAVKICAPNYVNTKPLPNDTGPIAVFNFIYRSKDALQQSLVIPRDLPEDVSPSPVRKFGELTQAEIERLARERFEEMQKNEKLKFEDDVKPGKRNFEEISELSGRAGSQRPAKRPAEYVDLTED